MAMEMPRKVCLIVNPAKEEARQKSELVLDILAASGMDVFRVAYKDSRPLPPEGNFDFAIVLGGDGSVLSAARLLAPRAIPIIPINMGRLGFLAEISWDEWEDCLELFLKGILKPVRRMMLEAQVFRLGQALATFNALNEGVITVSGRANLIPFRAEVSPPQIGEKHENLGSYRADGVLISTPTGSTAYSLASGGPILSPDVEALIFNPICPFTLSNRPVVVPSCRCIDIHLQKNRAQECLLSLDGQDSFPLLEGDMVRFRAAAYPALILPSGRMSFYDVLRTKLAWSGGTDA